MTFSNALPVQFWLNAKSTFNELEVCGVHSSCFCAPWNASDQIQLQFQHDEALFLVAKDSNGTEETPIELNRIGDLHSLAYTPSSHGFTDEQIQLLIKDGSNVTILKSDCLDIQESHRCTLLIDYYDTRNYDCLVYENTSPDQTFSIRVPAIFFHPEFPEEDEVIELIETNITTASKIRTQRLLDIDYMPAYMHYKLQLILKHKFVIIDELNWVKEEKYDLVKSDRRWPKRKASVLLTQKSSIVRNVL
jgi:hypothetical protein